MTRSQRINPNYRPSSFKTRPIQPSPSSARNNGTKTNHSTKRKQTKSGNKNRNNKLWTVPKSFHKRTTLLSILSTALKKRKK